MALTSSSTLTNAVAQYRDNMGWFTENSVNKAKLFVEALNFIIEARPTRSQGEDFGVNHDLSILERQLQRAMDWLQNHPDFDGALGTTYADLSGVRS